MGSSAGAGPFAGIPITDLGRQLRAGQLSARELTAQALVAADGLGATLNCFVTVDHEGAMRAAEQADRELAAGVDRGPMHGIPVGVKDLIDTAGLRTTRGSKHFAQHIPTTDADVVVSLRQAGAVLIGKTHTHQFAYGPTGDVSHIGPARNPHDPARVTGGSSSGSAAAIAAGIVPAALGTDTGGSVRIPAALCGVVGLRPTQDALSSSGLFPLSTTLDTAGPMAATVADTTVVWSALIGRPVPALPVTGLRVGVARMRKTTVAKQRQALERTVTAMADAGYHQRDIDLPDLAPTYFAIQSPEAYAVHAERIREAPQLYEPEVRQRLERAAEAPGWEYVSAIARRDRMRQHYLDRLGVDLIVLPTVPIEAPRVGARDTDLGAGWGTNPGPALLSYALPWSVLGLPAISIPVPADGLPSSVQLVGRPGSDDRLLAAAAMLAARLG